MVARVIRGVVLIALVGLIVAGCGRQVSEDPSQDPDLLATGPDPGSMPVPRPFVTASIDAAGGLPAWAQCRKLQLNAIVTADYPDGGHYLTKQQFTLYPWSDAIQVTAGEPRARLAWQVVRGRYSFEGDSDLDVSPLKGAYPEFAEAVLQIMTAPARMLDPRAVLTRRPESVQLTGEWRQPIDAKFQASEIASEKDNPEKMNHVEPRWTQGTYFQNQDRPFADVIWLGDPAAGKFILARGYDYARVASGDVLIPTKIEVFRSDSQAQFGPRIALIDLQE